MSNPNAPDAPDHDPEYEAIGKVYTALKSLEPAAQQRVIDYVLQRFALKPSKFDVDKQQDDENDRPLDDSIDQPGTLAESKRNDDAVDEEEADVLAGMSPVAVKWMRRNGLTAMQLAQLFSLGVDEIDLIATSIPGKTVVQRLRSVLLLQAIAAFLGSGTAKVSAEKLKQAASDYKADAGSNFWKYMKGMSPDVAGSLSSGFVLTARGMASATDLIKGILAQTTTRTK